MKTTNVSLCSFIASQAKERCICSWTRYTNLLAWFDNFKVFLIELGFAVAGCDGEPVFDEKMIHQILNLDAMDISVNRSKTIVGGRPEVSFHDPHLPMPSLTSAKSLHSSLAFLEVTPQDSVCMCTGSYRSAWRQKKGRGFASSSCVMCLTHMAGLDVRSRGNGRAPLGWMIKGAWTIRSLSAILTIALFPSPPTLRTCQGSVSCSRLTAAAVEIGRTCSTSVGSGVFTFIPACPTLPLCSRRRTSTSMVHSRVSFRGT